MKIGVTERGDPSIDFSWVEKMNEVDGAILITKNLTGKLMEEAMPFLDKLIFHVSCTGYGGMDIEPNIPSKFEQLLQAVKLRNLGVKNDRIVIRVDPIISTVEGLSKATGVIMNAYRSGFRRFRISVLDCYPHVRERFRDMGMELPYGEGKFTASDEMFKNVDSVVRQLKKNYPDICIESCAEGKLSETENIGCVSEKDLKLLGLGIAKVDEAGYQRKGCLCCSAKTELLSNKKQCPYKCLYCYWK